MKPGHLLPFTFGATSHGWHAIESFTRCPKEYQLAKVRGIKPTTGAVPEPLSVGLLLHAARAQWLNDNYDGDLWQEAIEAYAAEFQAAEQGTLFPGATTTAQRTFKEYVKFWLVRPRTKPLAVEHEIRPRPLSPGAPEWAWRGARYDSIEFLNGKAWIGELKSTSRGVSHVHDQYLLHGQVLLQMALWGEEETKQFGPLGGVLLDVVQKWTPSRPAKAFPRVQLPVAAATSALKWFRKDFATWVMQTHLIDWNTSVERRPVCQRSYGACDYKALCLSGRDGAVQYQLKDGTPLVRWQPSPGQTVPPWE